MADIKWLQGGVEAVLFTSGDPLSLDKLCEIFEADEVSMKHILTMIADRYKEAYSGLMLLNLNGDYQIVTKAKYGEQVKKSQEMRRNVPLSQAALEVLAIVAYNQPITRAFVEQVRGVDSNSVISSLISKGLIEEAGRLNLPGRPVAIKTTSLFLRSFSIDSLNQLPPIEREPLEEIVHETLEKKQASEGKGDLEEAPDSEREEYESELRPEYVHEMSKVSGQTGE